MKIKLLASGFLILALIVSTSGVKAIADEAECYWFLDIIASVQYMPEVQAQDHQTWQLKRLQGKRFVATMEDGNYNVIYSQDVPQSNFKDDHLTVWLINKTILLPSEN